MDYEGLIIEFIDVNPEGEIRDAIHLIGEGIRQLAPSDASVTFVIRGGRNLARASCRIVSLAGVFICEAIGATPLHAFKLIEHQMKQKLELWKKRRVLDFAKAS